MINITITTSSGSFNVLENLSLKESNMKIYALFILVISVAAVIINWHLAGGLGIGAILGFWRLYRLGPSFFKRTDPPQPSMPPEEEL
jgi:hypothetical protein